MQCEGNIYCNLRSCYKVLDQGYAYTTSCWHIFCAEDGEKIFKTLLKCPCCNKKLDSKQDLQRIKLNPNEITRKMILCGQRPHVVMEICSNAIAFWLNQLKEENDFTKYMIEKEREKRLSSEKFVESDSYFKFKQLQTTIDELKSENDCLKQQLADKKPRKLQVDCFESHGETRLKTQSENLGPLMMQQLYNKPQNFNNNLDKDTPVAKKIHF
jgi:hypothetical protein